MILWMECLSEMTLGEFEAHLRGAGFNARHGRRVLRAWYDRAGDLPLDLASLPVALQVHLQRRFASLGTRVAGREDSADGTVKLLIECADGQRVESVLMPDYRADRAAGCVSTQAGCAMGCDFCATARGGLGRNLTAGEIIEQCLHLKREAASQAGRRLRTLVFMGMGEPLLNYQNVVAAVRRLGCEELGAMGWRQITVSTVGLPAAMRRLADEGLGIHLALSLHGADDATRRKLIPAARAHSVAEVMEAAEYYQAKTGRPVTLQYCLLEGVNDSAAQAQALAALAGPRRMHVNVLLYNPTGTGLSGATYRRPSDGAIDAFVAAVRGHGAVAHIRRSRGGDIQAACGQLRRKAG